MKIRFAAAEDLPRLAELAQEFYRLSSALRDSFEPARFIQFWAGQMSARGGAIFVAEAEDGEVVGGLGFLVHPAPYSAALIASELFWFMSKSRRGGGLALLKEFEAFAEFAGCSQIHLSHMDLAPAALERIYARRGYEPVEKTFLKELTPCQSQLG